MNISVNVMKTGISKLESTTLLIDISGVLIKSWSSLPMDTYNIEVGIRPMSVPQKNVLKGTSKNADDKLTAI